MRETQTGGRTSHLTTGEQTKWRKGVQKLDAVEKEENFTEFIHDKELSFVQ